jgi:hypothetical protein
MNLNQLAQLTEDPETHRLIVGDYDGSYALGVTDNPPALLLRVEPRDVDRFPHKVKVRGAEVPVVVEGGFRPLRPQDKRG